MVRVISTMIHGMPLIARAKPAQFSHVRDKIGLGAVLGPGRDPFTGGLRISFGSSYFVCIHAAYVCSDARDTVRSNYSI